MKGRADWDELRDNILGRIRPGVEERRTVESFRSKMEVELTRLIQEAGLEAVAEAHGSVARGTWLSGERDIDLFIVLSPKYGRPGLQAALDIAKRYVGEGWVEAYAEHPYIRASIDGFDVEFVPCFRVDPRRGLISATDRTPLHTRFVDECLSPVMREEVMLLKQFMRGTGIYGAEIHVGGFSGYLCELLVIGLGAFEQILISASGWRQQEIVDLAKNRDEEELRKRFRNPLIVVDPVDPSRNVASAVSETSMWTFVGAARAFLSEPEEKFFFPQSVMVDPVALSNDLRKRGSRLLFLLVDDDEVQVPDVLWGQLYKAEKGVSRFLERNEFRVIRSRAWSDEKSRHIFVFELESATIPAAVKSMGPPVEMREGSDRFVQAHLGADSTVSGPWIEGRRWWVEMRRPHSDVRRLLDSVLRNGGRDIGVPPRLGQKIGRRPRILMDEEIVDHLAGDFADFLHDFLKGRPSWLG